MINLTCFGGGTEIEISSSQNSGCMLSEVSCLGNGRRPLAKVGSVDVDVIVGVVAVVA
jgi:hypothetical protein